MSNLTAAIDAITTLVSERGSPDRMSREQQDDMTILCVSVALETARNIERIADALEMIAKKS